MEPPVAPVLRALLMLENATPTTAPCGTKKKHVKLAVIAYLGGGAVAWIASSKKWATPLLSPNESKEEEKEEKEEGCPKISDE